MQQIKNGYCKFYYLTEDGRVYNAETKQYKEADREHRFVLKREDGTRNKIALKPLYKMVYKIPYCKDSITDLEGEKWEDIHNTQGLYYVSNMGRIKSYNGYEAIILKPTVTKSGYHRLDIIQDGVRVSKLVHRLVAAHFLPIPNNIDMELHHKDCNKWNNKSENLEWLSMTEHKKKHTDRRNIKCQ